MSKPSWKTSPSWLNLKHKRSYEKYLNIYCHSINLIKYFTNKKPKVIFSDLSEKKVSTVVLDHGNFSAILETGHFTPDGWDETFDIYFEKGTLKINLPPQHFKNKSAQILIYENKSNKIVKKYNFKSWSFQRQADGFVKDIINKKITHNRAAHAVDDIEVVEKIWRKFIYN